MSALARHTAGVRGRLKSISAAKGSRINIHITRASYTQTRNLFIVRLAAARTIHRYRCSVTHITLMCFTNSTVYQKLFAFALTTRYL